MSCAECRREIGNSWSSYSSYRFCDSTCLKKHKKVNSYHNYCDECYSKFDWEDDKFELECDYDYKRFCSHECLKEFKKFATDYTESYADDNISTIKECLTQMLDKITRLEDEIAEMKQLINSLQ